MFTFVRRVSKSMEKCIEIPLLHIPRRETPVVTVFTKGVPTDIGVEEIRLSAIDCHRARRLINRKTHLPTDIVELSLSNTDNSSPNQLITQGINIRGKIYPVTPKRGTKFIRCFNCNTFGHIAKTCKRNTSCTNCGRQYHVTADCKEKCSNCGGGHPADSSVCQFYKCNCTQISTQKFTY